VFNCNEQSQDDKWQPYIMNNDIIRKHLYKLTACINYIFAKHLGMHDIIGLVLALAQRNVACRNIETG